MAIFQGAIKDKIATEQRVDTRRWSVRMADAWSNPDDALLLALFLSAVSIVLNIMPLAALLISPVNAILARKFLQPSKRLHNVPYRIPKHLNMPDGSTSHTAGKFKPSVASKFWGKGVSMYGLDRETNLQLWTTDSDDRVHTLILGTTGSGKTELIHNLLFNQVLNNSGFIACDAKGEVGFYERQTSLLRRLARHDDLLAISYAAGKRDFSKPQDDKPSNTFNMMADTSAGMLTEIISGMLDSGGNGNDIWVGRCVAFVACLTSVLVYLRDQGEIELSPAVYLSYMELAEIERLANNQVYMNKYHGFEQVSAGLRDFLISLPGYIVGKTPGSQEGKTNEQFGFITMQLTRVFNDLGYNYGHIFGVEIGDVDISDVVFNRRCLAVMLPALERSVPTLNMLSKLIIASIKQMMAGSLGSALEGSKRLIVDSRPTSADSAFRVVLDEIGYMMSIGISIIPAQARGINIAMVFAAQSFSDIKRGSAEEAEAIWANCNMKMIGKLSDGKQSETVQKVQGIAGDVEQMYIDGYHQHENNMGDLIFRANRSARRESRPVIDWHDLAAQSEGQFHLIVSKTEDGAMKGGSRVIRFESLFTGDVTSSPDMYINSFIPVSRLVELEDYQTEQSTFLYNALMEDRLLSDINNICDSQTSSIHSATKQITTQYDDCLASSQSIAGLKNRVDSMVAYLMTSFNNMNKADTSGKNYKQTVQFAAFDDIQFTMQNQNQDDTIIIESEGFGEIEKDALITAEQKLEIGNMTKNSQPFEPLISDLPQYEVDVDHANQTSDWISRIVNDAKAKQKQYDITQTIKKLSKSPKL